MYLSLPLLIGGKKACTCYPFLFFTWSSPWLTRSSLRPPLHLVSWCLARLQASRECLTWGWFRPVGTTYLRYSRTALWGRCGACATQRLCLMSSKWPQTWALIHSEMRRPPSDDPAAACQGRPGTLPGSEGSQWEQSLGFKGDHCNLNEIVFPLQAFDCDESIRSRFSCLLWNIFFQKETQDSEVDETGDMWIWKKKTPPPPPSSAQTFNFFNLDYSFPWRKLHTWFIMVSQVQTFFWCGQFFRVWTKLKVYSDGKRNKFNHQSVFTCPKRPPWS